MHANYPDHARYLLGLGDKDASEVIDVFWGILDRFPQENWVDRLTPPYECNIEILTEREQPE